MTSSSFSVVKCFLRSCARDGSGARSKDDELDMLEIESKLRLRSLDERLRLDASNSGGDALRLVVVTNFVLPEM